MSTTTPPTPKRGSTSWSWADIMDRIRWPHAAIILGLVAGVVAILLLAPDTTIGHIIRAIGLLTGAGGTFGTVSRSGVLRGPDEVPPAATLPPRRVPSEREHERRSGHVTMELMVAVVAGAYVALRTAAWAWHLIERGLPALGLALVLGASSGCGASALGVHVRAAAVATNALEQVPEIVETIVEHRVENECGLASAGDVACAQALQLRMAPELAALDVGVIAVREPLTVYVSTLRLLAESDAGEEPDVVDALVSMAGRLVHAWPELVAALRALGADLPIPPLLELAAAAIGGRS